MQRATFGQQLLAAFNAVNEFNDAASYSFKLGFNDDLIVVARRREVATSGFGDRKECLFLALQIAILESTFPAVVGAPHFHPDQLVCVVHNAHLIGFRIAHSKATLRDMRHQDTFKTREGRSCASSCPMKCEALRSIGNETPVSTPSLSNR
jgi:hypothetical protein